MLRISDPYFGPEISKYIYSIGGADRHVGPFIKS
jgi:hypothetical protein